MLDDVLDWSHLYMREVFTFLDTVRVWAFEDILKLETFGVCMPFKNIRI